MNFVFMTGEMILEAKSFEYLNIDFEYCNFMTKIVNLLCSGLVAWCQLFNIPENTLKILILLMLITLVLYKSGIIFSLFQTKYQVLYKNHK